MSKEVEIKIIHNHSEQTKGPGRRCVGWFHKDEDGKEWGEFATWEADSSVSTAQQVSTQKKRAIRALGEDVNFVIRESPESVHTCLLFEDGKCVHCDKIPEYPVLEGVECE